MLNYKLYQKTLKQTFSKIPLIFQDNNYLSTDDIYIELALSDYSLTYQEKMDSISKKHYDNLPIVMQERKFEKEIRKLPIEMLFRTNQNRSFVVLGDPGSGKSTLLKTIAYRSALGRERYPKYIFHIELKKFVEELSRLDRLEHLNIITEYVSRYLLKEDRDVFRADVFDERPYFLIDGWDEIADSEMKSIILDSIYDTKEIANVIITSRRAGQLGGFDSRFEFFEIVGLSSRSIRNYILNFAKAQNINSVDARKRLLHNILNSESLLKMAQNPFLLSLICYLKAKELNTDLSYKIESRVELYYSAVEEIKREFNSKFTNRSFLATQQRILEGFSFTLFNYGGKTKHIFSEDDFLSYRDDREMLRRVFLPSKILDVFRDTNEIFFIHLTFQEFLTAMNLAQLEYQKSCVVIRSVIEKSSWREILRFYIGVLHSDFRPDDSVKKFDYLTKFAWDMRDELGIIESEIAYWFVEAGIEKPKSPFDGLKKSLWERFDKGKECAGKIFAPVLREWRDEDKIRGIVSRLEEPKKDLNLLKYIPFLANSSNIVYQQKIMNLMFSGSLTPPYPRTIASSLGAENRVELIEFYCYKIESMSRENIFLLLYLIASTQDSEYYQFIEPLLVCGDRGIEDEAYETAIKIKAEPFLEKIELFFKRYIEEENEEKFSFLFHWEDEKIIEFLNRYALDKTVSVLIRKRIMEVLYESMYRESISILNKDDYFELLQNEEDMEIRTGGLLMYSALLSVTPTERLRKEFMSIQKAEQYIVNIAVDKSFCFELRLASLQSLRANRLRGIQLFHIFNSLSDIIFDDSEDVELRNNAFEAICEQSFYFSDLSMVKEVFERGLREFDGKMLINVIFFVGQYGYSNYIEKLRILARNGDSPYIRGISIQSLGDLKDQESLEFIFNEFKTQNNIYIREISVESIIKLDPKLLLKYRDDDFVYSQLCLYVVESGEILRDNEIIMKAEEDVVDIRDVFISHASEDKQNIVEPLVQLLKENEISCWYDKDDIAWGESIVGEVSEGLNNSKYVLFIITRTFLAKKWTQIELNTTLNMQISSGEKKVLPILVGNIQHHELPLLLQDKKYIEWSHQEEIVDELRKILGKSIDTKPSGADVISIPMPKRRKKITQLEKDRFVKKCYQGIVKYFEEGLAQLKQHDNHIEIDMIKVNELKFVATVYLDGEIENQCKIWLDGTFSSLGINYYADSSGYIDINSDGTSNDSLFLEEDENELLMKGLGMMYMFQNQDKKIQNGQEAGAYFWTSFIQPLER